MSDSKKHHVTLRFVHGYEFVAEFDGRADFQPIVFDEPPPLGEGRAPNPAQVLSAAVGNCLAASFVFCLRKVRLDIENLTAHVTTRVTRNEKGRLRISGIDVELQPQLRESDRARFDRCEALFEDFCMVTASVRQGIPVTVNVTEVAEAEARQG